MEKIAILLTKAPYGEIHAAEAVRHALGAVADELEVSFILAEEGTLLALKGQDVGQSGCTNLGDSLADCVDMGINVYAEKDSLERRGLNLSDLYDGVQAIEGRDASSLIASADQVMIF